ncbi:hypothetical protein C8R46DRAFT_476205 [Mycena filopes]|nr:hypothetical protein C8R46DRAFT_476205 [Mycena filopes]
MSSPGWKGRGWRRGRVASLAATETEVVWGRLWSTEARRGNRSLVENLRETFRDQMDTQDSPTFHHLTKVFPVSAARLSLLSWGKLATETARHSRSPQSKDTIIASVNQVCRNHSAWEEPRGKYTPAFNVGLSGDTCFHLNIDMYLRAHRRVKCRDLAQLPSVDDRRSSAH